MKKFTNVFETCVTADVNPGNQLSDTGVTNHYTPIENIVTNVKNLYATHLGIVASVAEDGVSVKLQSSKFVNKEAINSVLSERFNNSVYNKDMSLYTYILSQGLDSIKMVPIGQYYIVYFSPSDITTAEPGVEPIGNSTSACEELENSNISVQEVEMQSLTIFNEDDDQELEDENKKQLLAILDNKDKVKAAKQLEALIFKAMNLPREYYFAGVKDKDGEESIALRWKYIKKRPHNKTSEQTRSLINIFGTGDEAIWIGDFDKDAMFKLPKEVITLINNLLEMLDAEKTNNPSVYAINMEKSSDRDNKDNDKDKDSDIDKDTDKDNKDDNDEPNVEDTKGSVSSKQLFG